MANTIRTYQGDGVTTLFPIDFELGYLRREFVFVYQGELEDYETQLSYTWVNDSQIELNSPIPVGEEFFIRRVIPRDRIINNYEDGSILREINLDDSHRQHVMISREIEDGFVRVNGSIPVNKDLDMQDTFRVINLANPVENGDAVNLVYLNSILADYNFQSVTPLESPRYIGDNSTTSFISPATTSLPASNFFVYLDGVKQRSIIDYTIENDGNVNFIEAPSIGTVIDITLFSPNIGG